MKKKEYVIVWVENGRRYEFSDIEAAGICFMRLLKQCEPGDHIDAWVKIIDKPEEEEE